MYRVRLAKWNEDATTLWRDRVSTAGQHVKRSGMPSAPSSRMRTVHVHLSPTTTTTTTFFRPRRGRRRKVLVPARSACRSEIGRSRRRRLAENASAPPDREKSSAGSSGLHGHGAFLVGLLRVSSAVECHREAITTGGQVKDLFQSPR